MQRIADLQPQGVPCAEPARRHAAVEHGVPEPDGVLCHAEELAAVLAGIAGAVDHHLDAVDTALGERERLRRRQAEPLDRERPLDGQEPVLARDVAHVRTRDLALLQPPEVGVLVRGVDDEHVPERLEPVRDQVVDDPAALVRQERVLRLPRFDAVEVVREQALQQLVRARSFDLDLAHVRDVEHAGVDANRPVLLDHPFVLNGHLPAGEGHHPRAERDVTIVERRPLQRLRHAVPILVRGARPLTHFAAQRGRPGYSIRRRDSRGGGPGRGVGS